MLKTAGALLLVASVALWALGREEDQVPEQEEDEPDRLRNLGAA